MSIIIGNNQKDSYYTSFVFAIVSYSITWSILFPLSMVYNDLSVAVREIWHRESRNS